MVMVFIVSVAIVYGKISTLLFIGLVGSIMTYEIDKNFFKVSKRSTNYVLSQCIFWIPFVFINFVSKSEKALCTASYMCIVMNLLMVIYLFRSKMQGGLIETIGNRTPYLSGFFALLPLLSLSYLMHFPNWRLILLLLLIVNFGMDSGAWFFGKSFGRHKLWPLISPNKTIEGLIGGMFISGLLGHLFWVYFVKNNSVWIFAMFAILGFMSQVGDLVQSKLKRQYNIKDSSSLIPGHGGVYDRIDSLVFVLPFFAATVDYYY